MKSHQFTSILVLLPHDKSMSHKTDTFHVVLKWQGYSSHLRQQTEVLKLIASFYTSYRSNGFR